MFETLDLALSQVDPGYKWPMDHCDVHHFVWEKDDYSAIKNNGNTIPMQYREIPFHKGYLPRQLHNFLHVIVAPPQKPSLEVMEGRVRAANLARHLFKMSQLAARYDQRPETFMTKRRTIWRTMSINEDMLLETLIKLQDNYDAQCEPAVFEPEGDLFDVARLTDEPVYKVAKYLGRFVARDALNLNPYVTSRRKATLAA